MDSLTHLAAGVLTPLAFRHTPKRAAVIGFGMAVGSLPDIDIFFGSGAEALLVLHRGISHALFWQPVLALLAVVPFYILMRYRKTETCPPYSFGRMYLVALVGVAIHLYLDAMTTFGTMIFLPFSPMRVAFPAVFIIDLVLTLPLLALLVLALRSPPDIIPKHGPTKAGDTAGFAFFSKRSKRLARMGLAWILIYPLLCLGVNTALTMRLTPDFTAPAAQPGTHASAGRLMLLPEPFSPFVWKAVVDDGQAYRMSVLFPLRHLGAPRSEEGPKQEQRFDKPDQQLYKALLQQNALFGQFRDFAPLMVQVERPAAQSGYETPDKEPGREYAFMDLRYVTPPGSPARWFGRTEPIFVLEARVKASGELLAYRFLKRGQADKGAPWIVIE